MFQTQCSGLWELRTTETRPHIPEPPSQGHSGQDESPGLELNVTGSQAGQSHGDKGLIRAQTENSGRTADWGFVPKLETWEDLTGWRSRSYRTLGPLSSLRPEAGAGPSLQPPWPPRQLYLLLPRTLPKCPLSSDSSQGWSSACPGQTPCSFNLPNHPSGWVLIILFYSYGN